MKKVISLFLIFTLIMCTNIVAFSASAHGIKAHDKINEILDSAKLVSYGDDGLTFSKVDKVSKSSLGVKNFIMEDNSQIFKKSTVKLIPLNDAAKQNLLRQAKAYDSDGGKSSKDKWDTSYTVYIYTTVYYDTISQNGDDYYQLYSIDGGYSSDGSDQTSVVGSELEYGQDGWASGGYKQQHAREYLGASGLNSVWNVLRPSSWVPVAADSTYQIGGTYTVTMRRPSGYTWDVALQNEISKG